METVEHVARINLVAELLGGGRPLPREEVDKLVQARGRYGFSTTAPVSPGCPAVAEDLGKRRHDGGETYVVTRDELIALVEEAMRARGG
jgi:L-fuculose-phosphate aldolase